MCRCLRGAVRSTTSIASINGFAGPSFGATTTRDFRGGGTAEASAARIVRRCTPCRTWPPDLSKK